MPLEKNPQIMKDLWLKAKDELSKLNTIDEIGQKVVPITSLVTDNPYQFILEHNEQILLHFKTIFDTLRDQKREEDETNKVYWFYCYYLAELLEDFYRVQNYRTSIEKFFGINKQNLQEEKYQKLKMEIKALFNKGEQEKIEIDKTKERCNQNKASFMHYVEKTLLEGLLDIDTLNISPSKVLGYFNMLRIYKIFAEAAEKELFKNTEFLKLVAYFDSREHLEQVKHFFDCTKESFVILSFALFGARLLLVEGPGFIMRSFFPNKSDADKISIAAVENTPLSSRTGYEYRRREDTIKNDWAWFPTNLICNKGLFGIDEATANCLTVMFLFYDLSMILWRLQKHGNEYIKAKALNREKFAQIEFGEGKENARQRWILQDELIKIERDWNVKLQESLFMASAALCLAVGFTASFCISPLGCYLICALAVAMYRSSAKFGEYRAKAERVKGMENMGIDDAKIDLAMKERDLAEADFNFTLARNYFMPLLLVSSFALFPPSTLALAVVCIGIHLKHYKTQFEGKKQNERLAGQIPDDTPRDTFEQLVKDDNELQKAVLSYKVT